MDIGKVIKTVNIPKPDEVPAKQIPIPDEEPIEVPNWPIRVPDWPIRSPIPVKEPAKAE